MVKVFVLRKKGHARRISSCRAGSGRRVVLAAVLAAGVLGVVTAAPAAARPGHAAAAPHGRVLAWGWNSAGQLGIPTGPPGYRSTPEQVPGLEDIHVTSVAASEYHNLAVTKDGHVYAWGWNGAGQLGVKTELTPDRYRPTPERVPGLQDVDIVAAAAGYHSLALSRGGRVYAWGPNSYGQLGVPPRLTPDGYRSPALVPRLSGIAAIAAGDEFSLALSSGGRVFAWGSNGDGELGVPPRLTLGGFRSVPALVPRLSGIIAIASGEHHSLALSRDGQVYAWGSNGDAQLGIPRPPSYRSTPEPVQGLKGVIAIATSGWHNLALTRDGQVYAWGWNRYGQLGVPLRDTTHITGFYRSTPEPVPGLEGIDITAIAAAGYHSMALTREGRVYAWGSTGGGMLGIPPPEERPYYRYTPELVPDLKDIAMIAAAGHHSLAITRAHPRPPHPRPPHPRPPHRPPFAPTVPVTG